MGAWSGVLPKSRVTGNRGKFDLSPGLLCVPRIVSKASSTLYGMLIITLSSPAYRLESMSCRLVERIGVKSCIQPGGRAAIPRIHPQESSMRYVLSQQTV
jgi:hypothetical protein